MFQNQVLNIFSIGENQSRIIGGADHMRSLKILEDKILEMHVKAGPEVGDVSNSSIDLIKNRRKIGEINRFCD